MTYQGLTIQSGTTPMPVDVGGATATFTLAAAGSITNASKTVLYVAAADVTPEGVGTIRRARLVPGGTLTLSQPQGVWLVQYDTQLRLEWAAGVVLSGTFVLWGLAGWGAGDIIGRIIAARRRAG